MLILSYTTSFARAMGEKSIGGFFFVPAGLIAACCNYRVV